MRGHCEFDDCQCPTFKSCGRLCELCNHGKVWHKNIKSEKKKKTRHPGFTPIVTGSNSPKASAPYLPSPINRIDMSCLVCQEHRRTVLVLPCRHFVLCETCYDNISHKSSPECVMCRQIVTDCIKDIYI